MTRKEMMKNNRLATQVIIDNLTAKENRTVEEDVTITFLKELQGLRKTKDTNRAEWKDSDPETMHDVFHEMLSYMVPDEYEYTLILNSGKKIDCITYMDSEKLKKVISILSDSLTGNGENVKEVTYKKPD